MAINPPINEKPKKDHHEETDDPRASQPRTAAFENANSSRNEKGALEKAREKIHEKVATDEELLDEKPPLERVKAKMPTNTHEVAEAIGNSWDSVREKYRAGREGTEREEQKKKQTEPQGVIEPIRRKIYEATKSPDVKDRQEFEREPVADKIRDLNEDAKRQPMPDAHDPKTAEELSAA